LSSRPKDCPLAAVEKATVNASAKDRQLTNRVMVAPPKAASTGTSGSTKSDGGSGRAERATASRLSAAQQLACRSRLRVVCGSRQGGAGRLAAVHLTWIRKPEKIRFGAFLHVGTVLVADLVPDGPSDRSAARGGRSTGGQAHLRRIGRSTTGSLEDQGLIDGITKVG